MCYLPEDIFLYLEPTAIVYPLYPGSVGYTGLGTKEVALSVLLGEFVLST